VIVLQDASDPDVLQRLAKRLDMNCRSIERSGKFTAFLSREPMDKLIDLSEQSKFDVVVAEWSIIEKKLSVAFGSDPPPKSVMLWVCENGKSPGWIEPKLHEQIRIDETSSNVQPARVASKLLVSERVKLIDAWIERDRLAVYASDHLPVGVEIEL
ncbi:MAG TPA: hypothetical protein PK402_06675, partial [Tepidisphaeraceae bacterium]|nr:hypothetical protein [Tepidisphaeraceae bacterium]